MMKLESMYRQLSILSDAIINLKLEVERELTPKPPKKKSRVQQKKEEIAAKYFGAQAKKAAPKPTTNKKTASI